MVGNIGNSCTHTEAVPPVGWAEADGCGDLGVPCSVALMGGRASPAPKREQHRMENILSALYNCSLLETTTI